MRYFHLIYCALVSLFLALRFAVSKKSSVQGRSGVYTKLLYRLIHEHTRFSAKCETFHFHFAME